MKEEAHSGLCDWRNRQEGAGNHRKRLKHQCFLLNAFYSITYRTPRCLVQKSFIICSSKKKAGHGESDGGVPQPRNTSLERFAIESPRNSAKPTTWRAQAALPTCHPSGRKWRPGLRCRAGDARSKGESAWPSFHPPHDSARKKCYLCTDSRMRTKSQGKSCEGSNGVGERKWSSVETRIRKEEIKKDTSVFVAQIYKKAVNERKRLRVKESKRLREEGTKRGRDEERKSLRD